MKLPPADPLAPAIYQTSSFRFENSARGEAMEMVRGLEPEQLGRTGRHEVAGTITIEGILHHVAYHDLLHIAQIAKLLSLPLDARRGGMATSFPDEE